jgi:hypothetical protein
MHLLCVLGLHEWAECVCQRCAVPRKLDAEEAEKLHARLATCVCAKCGFKVSTRYSWRHKMNGCTCTVCGQRNKGVLANHDWQVSGVCSICQERCTPFMGQVIAELLALEVTQPDAIKRPAPSNLANYDGLTDSLGAAAERVTSEALSFHSNCGLQASQFLPDGKRTWKIGPKRGGKFTGRVNSHVVWLQYDGDFGNRGCTRDLTVYRTGPASFGVFVREDEWD